VLLCGKAFRVTALSDSDFRSEIVEKLDLVQKKFSWQKFARSEKKKSFVYTPNTVCNKNHHSLYANFYGELVSGLWRFFFSNS
jgi:hypothetical protein